jgi:hypothetical protein
MKILCDGKKAVVCSSSLRICRTDTLLCYRILKTKIQLPELYKQLCAFSNGQCGKKLLPYCQLHLHAEFCSVLHVRRKIWIVFLFHDTSRYIRYVTCSGNFLCNLYAIRLHRHLLLRMYSHLKQLRNLVKKKNFKLISVRFLTVQVSNLFLSTLHYQLDIMPYWNNLFPSVALKLERLRHWNSRKSFIFEYE